MQTLGSISRPDQLGALADEHRLALLRRLMCGPSTLSRLGRDFDRHPAWIRHHLKRLESVGLVEYAGEKTTRNYTEKFYRATSSAFAVHLLVAPDTGARKTVMMLGSDDFLLRAYHLQPDFTHHALRDADRLRRDADQQFADGTVVEGTPQPGDLLYFGEPEEDYRPISHVAVSLGGMEMIHANGAAGGISYNSLDPSSPLYREWLDKFLQGVRRFA